MSVEQLDVIDDLRIEGQNGPAVLTILDPLDWADPSTHLTTLQQKFNVYLAFVEGGQLLERYPEASGMPVVFYIVFKHSPGPIGGLFLDQARTALASAGVGLSFEVVEDAAGA